MPRELVVIAGTASIAEAVQTFAKTAGRHLPVVDAHGKVMGVLHRSELEAQGAFVDDEWFAWGTATVVTDLLSMLPQVQLSRSRPLSALFDALLDHTAVAIVNAEGALVDVFTDTDGVREAVPLLDDTPALVLMQPPMRTIRPEAPAWAALRELRRCEARHLVVVDALEPVGVVSIRDLEAESIAKGSRLTVADVILGQTVITAPHTCTAREAAKRMFDDGIGCLPLVDADRDLVALITRRDILRAAVATASTS